MPVTTYLDPAMQVWALQTRTDETGVDIEDSSAAEGRLVWRMFTEGVNGDSYEVTAAGGSMTVVVGSGTAFTDMAVVSGDTAALGNYGVLLEPASQNVVVPAADLSNPRIDQIFLVVVDDPGTPLVTTRLGYRQGDAAATPSAPGPDSGWEGSLLLASIAVGAGVTEIVQGNVTDDRSKARLASGLVSADSIEDLSVTTADLADGAVIASKLASNAVTDVKINTSAVTTAKIVDAAVTTAKLADNSVSGAKGAATFLDSFILLGGTTGSPSVSTSDGSLISDPVTIPANWNSWSVVATAAGVYAVSGSVSNVRLYLRPTSGALDGPFNDFDFTPDGNSMPYSVTLYRSGITATGTQSIAFRGSKTGAGSVSLPAASLSFVIRRDS